MFKQWRSFLILVFSLTMFATPLMAQVSPPKDTPVCEKCTDGTMCEECKKLKVLEDGQAAFKEQKYEEAFKLLYPLTQSEIPNVDAAWLVAQLFQFGVGAEKDLDKAVELYEHVANAGHAAAMLALANVAMLEEEGWETDFSLAVGWVVAASATEPPAPAELLIRPLVDALGGTKPEERDYPEALALMGRVIEVLSSSLEAPGENIVNTMTTKANLAYAYRGGQHRSDDNPPTGMPFIDDKKALAYYEEVVPYFQEHGPETMLTDTAYALGKMRYLQWGVSYATSDATEANQLANQTRLQAATEAFRLAARAGDEVSASWAGGIDNQLFWLAKNQFDAWAASLDRAKDTSLKDQARTIFQDLSEYGTELEKFYKDGVSLKEMAKRWVDHIDSM